MLSNHCNHFVQDVRSFFIGRIVELGHQFWVRWKLTWIPFIPFMRFSQQVYWGDLPLPCPVEHIFSELSAMTSPSWVALPGMAHSFTELCKAFHHDKAVVHEGYHWCNGHELGQTLGDGDGQRGLVACCSPRGHKEIDTTGQLNNNLDSTLTVPLPLFPTF